MITGYPLPDNRVHEFGRPGLWYVSKPFMPRVLAHRIDEVLAAPPPRTRRPFGRNPRRDSGGTAAVPRSLPAGPRDYGGGRARRGCDNDRWLGCAGCGFTRHAPLLVLCRGR
jgi:hypothetical protein